MQLSTLHLLCLMLCCCWVFPRVQSNVPDSKQTLNGPTSSGHGVNRIANPFSGSLLQPQVEGCPAIEGEGRPTSSGQGVDRMDNPTTDPHPELDGCPAIDENLSEGSHCVWMSEQGVRYDLLDFSKKQYHIGLPSPRGSTLKFQICSHPEPNIICKNGKKSPTCLSIPGVSSSSTGMIPRIEQVEPNIPNMGIRLVYDDGDICEVTGISRKTIITLPCSNGGRQNEDKLLAQQVNPHRAYEGQKKEICHYFVEFPPSKYGCPVEQDVATSLKCGSLPHKPLSLPEKEDGADIPPPTKRSPPPQILAVTGCHNSSPARTTKDCHFAGTLKLVIHGKNFHTAFCKLQSGTAIPPGCLKNFSDDVEVFIGDVRCSSVALTSPYDINCTLVNGAGKDQDVTIKVKAPSVESGWEVAATLEDAVSFKERVNYRERFRSFVELGVGGMKKEIDELYRRAFASRGTSPELLEQLGISHVKGILLYGPPGSGKTLLARTIGKILGSDQVSLINAPEIISKYLGESEKNLRSHFKKPHQHWEEYGPLSDLFVIIIDEIDAICKPRGKSDQSSAGVAYDALVNQLLTLMDGLDEVHNTLVMGLTNRRELMDPALLRPGRFEIQIEVNLPDESGRKEIFDIHTREMKKNGLLGADVNMWELAANTSRFSGAEIAGVVRTASSYALERHQKQLDPDLASTDSPNFLRDPVLVTLSDFVHAILSISPTYTQSQTQVLASFLPLGYLPCGDSHDIVIDSTLDMMHIFMTSTSAFQSLLLYGPRGSGKTTLAVHLAMMGKFSFIKILTASSLVGMHDSLKVDLIHQTFYNAYKSETAVIILDDLARLVECVQVAQQLHVAHHLLHTLSTLLTSTPPPGTKLLVIGTIMLPDRMSLEESLALGFPDLFMQHEFVSVMGTEDIRTFIIARNIRRLGGGQFSLPSNLALPVRQAMLAVDCACARSEVDCSMKPPYHTSQLREQHLLDCIMNTMKK